MGVNINPETHPELHTLRKEWNTCKPLLGKPIDSISAMNKINACLRQDPVGQLQALIQAKTVQSESDKSSATDEAVKALQDRLRALIVESEALGYVPKGALNVARKGLSEARTHGLETTINELTADVDAQTCVRQRRSDARLALQTEYDEVKNTKLSHPGVKDATMNTAARAIANKSAKEETLKDALQALRAAISDGEALVANVNEIRMVMNRHTVSWWGWTKSCVLNLLRQ